MESELPVRKTQHGDISLDLYEGISCFSHNLSQSGMLCHSSRQINEMTLLDIRFQLPADKEYSGPALWVECVGVVIRCEKKATDGGEQPYEVEIFFDKMSQKHRDLLNGFFTAKVAGSRKRFSRDVADKAESSAVL